MGQREKTVLFQLEKLSVSCDAGLWEIRADNEWCLCQSSQNTLN